MAGRKIKEQQQARKLRAKGKSLNQIVRQLEVAKSSVSVWVRDVRLTKKQQSELKQRELSGGAKGRKKALRHWQEYRKRHPMQKSKGPRWPERSVETFFDAWTTEMAYVLGFFAADGSMYKNRGGSYYVGFSSIDREQIALIRRLMGASNNIESYQSQQPNHKRRYTLQIGSTRLYRQLIKLSFTPRKSLTLQFPSVPLAVLKVFTRGYFDGDGYVFFARYKRKDRNSAHRSLRSGFTSGSRTFLDILQNRLQAGANMGLGSLHPHASNWELSYSTNDSRHLYKFMYPTATVPCLKRKKLIFEEALVELE